jgi:hypothetical protein
VCFHQFIKIYVIYTFETFAYVLTSESPSAYEYRRFLRIFDISDPTSPTLIDELDLGSRFERLFAQGNFLYIVRDDELVLVDVSNPYSATLKSSLNDPRLSLTSRDETGGMWASNGYAYILTCDRNDFEFPLFHNIEVFNPDNPIYNDTFSYVFSESTGRHHTTDIIVEGKYLYLGVYWDVFLILDLSNPVNPQLIEDGESLPFGNEGWGASWSLGNFTGEYLTLPTIFHLKLVDLRRDSQGLVGPITVDAHINSPNIYLQIVFRFEN